MVTPDTTVSVRRSVLLSEQGWLLTLPKRKDKKQKKKIASERAKEGLLFDMIAIERHCEEERD